MKIGYVPFDAALYLDSDEAIAEYLTAAAEDQNPDVFLAAQGDVAKVRMRREIVGAMHSLHKVGAVSGEELKQTSRHMLGKDAQR